MNTNMDDNSMESQRESDQAAQTGEGTLGDYLLFRRMLIPLFIQVIFWIGVGFILVSGLGTMALSVTLGLVTLVLGIILWRAVCEIIILAYRINETLTSIDNKLSK